MSLFMTLFNFANDIMTFYLPIFFTFKFLSNQNPANISKILKFWCVLTFSKILQYVYSKILADNLDIILDLSLHLLLIINEFTYSEKIYDSIIRPFYKNNEETINSLSKTLEKYFEKKTQQVQSKVTESAGDKIKGFVGDILVGTLNPGNNKKKESQEQKEPVLEDDDDKED